MVFRPIGLLVYYDRGRPICNFLWYFPEMRFALLAYLSEIQHNDHSGFLAARVLCDLFNDVYVITGCAVAQHCCNDDQQSQWENGDFDPL